MPSIIATDRLLSSTSARPATSRPGDAFPRSAKGTGRTGRSQSGRSRSRAPARPSAGGGAPGCGPMPGRAKNARSLTRPLHSLVSSCTPSRALGESGLSGPQGSGSSSAISTAREEASGRRADPVPQRPDLGVHAPRLPVLVDPVVALPFFVHPFHESGAHCFEGRQRALLPRALRLPGARPRGHARRGPAVEGADLLRRFAQGLSRDVYPRARAFAAGAEHPPRCLPDEQVRVDAQGRLRHVPAPSGGRDR